MQSTRQRIVELLKERGHATVEELADAVGLTQMAVRHHLNVLNGEKLVATSSVRRSSQPGRPQQLYTLTEAANELFPEDYYHLAGYLLAEVKALLGAAGLEALLGRIAKAMLAEAPPLRPGQSPEDRLGQLVQLLGDRGFTARWAAQGNDYVVRLLACPYRQVAHQHHEVCRLDLQIIEDMLKADAVRVACLADGDETCTYRIHQPIGPGIGD
jgi:predicted ArsR family transcriptional regulator